MMPLGAPSISKYGSLVRPGAQIVALRAHCALGAPPMRCGCPIIHHTYYQTTMMPKVPQSMVFYYGQTRK